MSTPKIRWISALAGLAVAICAGAAAALELHGGEDVAVEGEQSQMVFAAGETVTLSLNATDDVFSAGSDIIVRGAKLAHFISAGGEMSFENFTAGDVIAAAGEIDVISGEISDDLVAAGGRIELKRTARIGGDVVVSGGEIVIEAPVGAGVRAAGGEIQLDSEVAGDVYLDGRRVTIGPEARIHGTLTHRARTIEISPQAQIDGEVTALAPRPEPDFARMAQIAAWMTFSVVVGFVLLGVLIASVLPRLMNDVAQIAREHPLSMFAFGLVLAVFMPILVILFLITVFGIPIALVLGAAFALMWFLAFVSAGYAFGMFLRSRIRQGEGAPDLGERALWVTIGLVVLCLACFIPVVGIFVWFAATFLGLGAVALQTIRALSQRGAAPVAA